MGDVTRLTGRLSDRNPAVRMRDDHHGAADAVQAFPDDLGIVVHTEDLGAFLGRARQIDGVDRPSFVGELRQELLPAPGAVPCSVHEQQSRPVVRDRVHAASFPGGGHPLFAPEICSPV